MRNAIRNLLEKLGYEVKKISKSTGHDLSPYVNPQLTSSQIVDLDSLAHLALSIPGMIAPFSGQIMYSLCYFQQIQGDVVEIGSWQGRSSSFFARAVKNSGNGSFFAVDHFKGNTGKEMHYVVDKTDLSDLRGNFIANMKKLEVLDAVNLLDMPNHEAAKLLMGKEIRFLFIDGDHSQEGVEKDIELFFPMLVKHSMIVFDDFSQNFPGLLKTVNSLLNKKDFSRVMSYHNTLILMV